jgi:hypothetical protein
VKELIISILATASVMLLALCCYKTVKAGLYIEAGLGVPLSPETGYIPDQYGVFNFGYNHPIDDTLSFDLAYKHRSLTGKDDGQCASEDCNGDNAIEGLFRLEW